MYVMQWSGTIRLIVTVGCGLLIILLSACSEGRAGRETALVATEQLALRSSTAKVARVVAELRLGDRVTILERVEDGGINWAKLRAPDGRTGWVETRYLVSEETVERSRRLADSIKPIPPQAIGRLKATLRLRLTPNRERDDNIAILLPSGTMVEIIDRERRPRALSSEAKESLEPAAERTGGTEGRGFDEWYQVRLPDNSLLPAGWIYAGSIELAVPPEISYYASSGRRIVGWQKLGTARDLEERAGDHYLVLERRIFNAHEAADFDRIKVLAYDPSTRDYSTPFREDVMGQLPVRLSLEGKRGHLQITALDKGGTTRSLDYTVEMIEGNRVSVTKLRAKEPARGQQKR